MARSTVPVYPIVLQSPSSRQAVSGVVLFLLAAIMATSSWADCAPDYRSDKNSGIYIEEFVITGTTTLSSAQLQGFRSKLTGTCTNDSTDDLTSFVKEAFQNEGYYAVQVKSLDIETIDPLARPKRVRLQADVIEGGLYRLGEINVSGNQGVSTAELGKVLSLQNKQAFKRSAIASGFDGVRKLYSRNGFGDFYFVVEDTPNESDSTVNLNLAIVEGLQYRTGKLTVAAKKDIADQLQTTWRIPAGAVFDFTYPQEYVRSDEGLLPADFTATNVLIIRNCPDALVDVWLVVDPALFALQTQPTDKKCAETTSETH
ncbi:MAG TPA: POTRA domain-containing protein [Terriglobales bacterium]|nr:POTRA domain-containing protein [Terriglobales bacterium]